LISLVPTQSHASELEDLHKLLLEIMVPIPEPGRSIWLDHIWEDLPHQELGKKHGKTQEAIRTSFCRTNARVIMILSKSPKLMKRLRDFLR